MKKICLLAGAALLTLCGCSNNNGLPMKRSDAVKKVKALGESKGYQITFKLLEGENEYEVKASMKTDVAWFTRNDNEGIALKKADNYYHVYLMSGQDPQYVQSYKEDQFELIYANGNLLFSAYNILNANFTKGEATTIKDRKCTYYSFENSFLNGDKYNYKVALDDELGICLALECTSADAKKESKYTFAATNFQIGGEIAKPELATPATIIEAGDASKNIPTGVIPNNKRITLVSGDKYHAYVYLERKDDTIYVSYNWNNESTRAFYVEVIEGKSHFYIKDNGEDYWSDCNIETPTGATSVLDGNLRDALAWLAGYIGSACTDMFGLELLDSTVKYIGVEVVNNMPTNKYETKDTYYYRSFDYDLFVKYESKVNPEWNYEVIDIEDIDQLTDSPRYGL